MSLRLKANLAYLATALVLLALALPALRGAATAEAACTATLLTAEADVAGQYTREQVAPLLDGGSGARLVFVPQSTPFYAVDAQARLLAQRLPGYALRQVVLDPAGRRDQPDAWERAAIDRLRAEADPVPFTALRRDAAGRRRLLLVTPLRLSPGVCATCYPSRAAAPPALVDAFGAAAGFDRKPGEIVGVTIASVPLDGAGGLSGAALGWLLGAVLALGAVFNLVLELLVLRPLSRVAAVAEQVSLGRPGVAEFDSSGDAELDALTRSFNRLRRSMESAIGLVDR